ncbi:MAG: hypothetical protein JXB15_11125 [Anaerolineales bacterium]|nr:hypothetical protein [Anaerolineales bacterium]
MYFVSNEKKYIANILRIFRLFEFLDEFGILLLKSLFDFVIPEFMTDLDHARLPAVCQKWSPPRFATWFRHGKAIQICLRSIGCAARIGFNVIILIDEDACLECCQSTSEPI